MKRTVEIVSEPEKPQRIFPMIALTRKSDEFIMPI